MAESTKKIEWFELKEKQYKQRLDQAEKDLKVYDELRSWLRMAINVENIYDNIHRVEELVKNRPQVGVATPNGVEVSECRPVVTIGENRPSVKVDDKSWEGRILVLAKKHSVFTESLTRGKVQDCLDKHYGERGRPQNIDAALIELVQKRILWREKDKSNTWIYSLTEDSLDRIKEAS